MPGTGTGSEELNVISGAPSETGRGAVALFETIAENTTKTQELMNTQSRRIAVSGTSNLRDIGGFAVADGRSVAYRTLYRAEALVMPGGSPTYAIYDESAGEQYERMGVRTVVDLRAQVEIDRAASAWPRACGARLVELPIAEGGEGADTDYIGMLLDGRMSQFAVSDMSAFYVGLLENRADVLADAYRVMADTQSLPALIHCAAGKDRTGVFVALLLSSLGVSDDDVAEDYALTGILRPNRVAAYADRFAAAGRDPDVARVLFESPAEAMYSTLSYLKTRYGGSAGYLTMAGVGSEVLDAVRKNFLDR